MSDQRRDDAIAAALHAVAQATAIQAETNAVLAAQMERLTESVRGVQGRMQSEVAPMIERAKRAADELARARAEVRRGGE